MSMHPLLTTVVYILIIVAFITMMVWMFVYNLRMKRRDITRELKGREPIVPEEGILLATREKEHRTVPRP
jgi:flagellar biosynthesis protein FlhB